MINMIEYKEGKELTEDIDKKIYRFAKALHFANEKKEEILYNHRKSVFKIGTKLKFIDDGQNGGSATVVITKVENDCFTVKYERFKDYYRSIYYKDINKLFDHVYILE